MSKAGQPPKAKAAAPKAVAKASPSGVKAATSENNARPLTYNAPGSSSSAVSTGSTATAYPKAPPEKPRTSVTYSGPPGPSRDAALRACPKATADEPLRLAFELSSAPALAFRSQSPLPPSPVRKINSAEADPKRNGDSEVTGKSASSAKKRSGSSKKRRAGNVASTRPQPFSFSTDTRKARRGRQNGLVVHEGGEASKAAAKSRPKWFGMGMSVPKSTSQSNLLSTITADSTPQATQGTGASSSSDHWTAQEDAIPTVQAAPPTGPGTVSAANTTSLTSARRLAQGDLHIQTQNRTIVRQKSAGILSNDEPNSPMLQNSTIPATQSVQPGGSSASTTGTPRTERRQIGRMSSRDTFGPENRTRQVPPVSKEPESYYWSPFTNSAPGLPMSPPLSERGNRPQVQQRTRIASARDYQVRPDVLVDDGQDDELGPTGSVERTRSTSILRGRLGGHLARAAASQHAEYSSAGDGERHVSFQAAEEVRQFCVAESVPNTTRVSRRVFGGDLQVVLGSGSSTTSAGNHRSQGLGAIPHGTAVDRKTNVLVLTPSAPRPCIRDLQGVD